MSLPATWPTEGQDLLSGILHDRDPSLLLHAGCGDSGVFQTDGSTPAVHNLLPEFDCWPFASSAGLEAAGPADWLSQAPAASASPESPSPSASPPTDDKEGLSDTPVEFEALRSKNIYVELPRSALVHPKSQYAGFTPPLPPSSERNAVASLLAVAESHGRKAGEDFIEFELDSFSFYIDAKYYPVEMRPLQHMDTRMAHDRFYFDGLLSAGSVRHYVQRVEVVELPIGNYGAAHPTVRGKIWARSKLNARREIYYRLNKPAAEYARFYTPFLWVADLAKHVVDFSGSMVQRGRQVGLDSFQADFAGWMRAAHGGAAEFQRWRRGHPDDDFRTAVAAGISFIWKEMNGVLSQKTARSLQLFSETVDFTRHKPTPPLPVSMIVQGRGGDEEREPPTIVTPYIKECFGHMILGKMLRTVDEIRADQLPTPPVQTVDEAESAGRPATAPARIPSSRRTRTSEACFLPLDVIDRIQVGDTISTPRDGESTDTKWQSMASKGAIEDGRWFGLVQRVHVGKDQARSFDVTWFYRPVETPCCMMKYPWGNELFLSDHCTCEEGSSARVKEHEVLALHDIDWFGSPNGDGRGEFFVRQTYMVEGRRWITLQRRHMTCSHGREKLGFDTGDTVLAVLSPSQAFSEPHEVVKIFRQGEHIFVRLRKLLCRRKVDPGAGAPPNELVYTDQLVVAKPDKIVGRCLVRFFRPGEAIPTPYDRGGTGNLFYITHRLEAEREDGAASRCVPLDGEIPASLRQAFDPTRQAFRKLRGMDLFCGSGNFGRGLEEGGAVEMHWAADIWDVAMHTYMANAAHPDATRPFLGSVDDLLRRALEGKYAHNVPRPGDVDFISAGSPCPGFSLLTQDKTALTQMKNQSLVASFASFVDFYRPKYGILENVVTIVQARHNRSEDVLSQLFCAVVGMGYQAQLVLGDAWSHGAPQCRSRVFLYFAAPGLRLPEAPLLSHSHFPGASARGLGEMCNSEPFVRRSFQPTPFKYVSAAEGTADLPRILDGKAEPVVGYPDHRVSVGVTATLRHQIATIPTHPHGMSFAKAWHGGEGGVMTPAERGLFPRAGFRVSHISKGWRRVRPGDVFQTVTTRGQPTDGRSASGLHWYEDRPVTVLEMRRAQGFPDREVLLGRTPDQWKLVGNSVARQMALALGLKFREAWVGLRDEGERARDGATAEGVNGSVLRGRTASVVAGERRRASSSLSLSFSSSPSSSSSVAAAAGRQASHARSASRQIVDLTAAMGASDDGRPSAAPGNVIDLTSDPGRRDSERRSIPGDPARPDSELHFGSLSGGDTDGTNAETPGSLASRPGSASEARKRLLSQSLGAEPEAEPGHARSAKNIRLSSTESIPVPGPEGAIMDSRVSGMPMAEVEDAGLALGEDRPPEGGGPTIVRLMTPEPLGSDEHSLSIVAPQHSTVHIPQ